MRVGQRLYFVRHGQSTWNLDGRIQGQALSPPLTGLGREQARQAARRLVGTGVATLLTSDAARTQQTAEIIGSVLGLPATPTPLLREQHWGDLQGHTSDRAWAVADGLTDEQPFPGGESRREVRARLEQLLRSDVLRNATGPVVLVSHGDTIAQAYRLLSGDDTAAPPPANGSVTCIAEGGNGHKVRWPLPVPGRVVRGCR